MITTNALLIPVILIMAVKPPMLYAMITIFVL
jgi:hypothetical protein